MYGLTSIQTYSYFMTYPKDRPAIKLLVRFSGCPTIHPRVTEAFDSQVTALWYDPDCFQDVVLIVRRFPHGRRILDTLHLVVVSHAVHNTVIGISSGPDALLQYLESRINW